MHQQIVKYLFYILDFAKCASFDPYQSSVFNPNLSNNQFTLQENNNESTNSTPDFYDLIEKEKKRRFVILNYLI